MRIHKRARHALFDEEINGEPLHLRFLFNHDFLILHDDPVRRSCGGASSPAWAVERFKPAEGGEDAPPAGQRPSGRFEDF
jgi:hypothetical protein